MSMSDSHAGVGGSEVCSGVSGGAVVVVVMLGRSVPVHVDGRWCLECWVRWWD